MGMILKKRQLIAASLMVALSAAVFANWYFTKNQSPLKTVNGENVTVVSSEAETDNPSLGDAQLVNAKTKSKYFTNAKLKREEAHDDALDALEEVIKDSSSSADAISTAKMKLEELSSAIKLEADMENLITAKIGSESLVTINDGKVQVVVNKGVLNDTVSTQITDIILAQSQTFSGNITLIEAK